MHAKWAVIGSHNLSLWTALVCIGKISSFQMDRVIANWLFWHLISTGRKKVSIFYSIWSRLSVFYTCTPKGVCPLRLYDHVILQFICAVADSNPISLSYISTFSAPFEKLSYQFQRETKYSHPKTIPNMIHNICH